MAKKAPDINLLKAGKVNILEQIFNWAVSAGRIIVILIEVIALSAFIYRFSLDRELIDLRSQIKQEQALVDFFKDNEKTYRNLQDRLSTASTFADQSSKKVDLFNDIVELTPPGIFFNNLSIYEGKIRVNANTNSVTSLSLFVESLKSYPLVKGLSVDKIESKPSSSLITFVLSAELKQEKQKDEK